MGTQYKKPYRKRNRYKMKNQGAAFSYGIGRRGRGASATPQSVSTQDIVKTFLTRMGFKSSK